MPPTRYVQTKNIVYTLTVDGKSYGIFTKGTGFDLTAAKVQYGEGPVAAGVRTRGDASLARAMSDIDAALEKELEDKIGFPVAIGRSYQGDDGLPLGTNRTFDGVLLGVTTPDGDSTASERGEFTVSVGLNNTAS